MHRILLILFLSLLGGCTNHQTFRQITFEKKEYKTTKRLPFITSACSSKGFFPNEQQNSFSSIHIWEDGEYRISDLYREPFDAIEDLRIYQSNDYSWWILFLPYVGGGNCNQYHITGYLIYFDAESKQKWNTKLQNEKTKTQTDLPIMMTREYRLIDSETLALKKEEQKKIEKETKPRSEAESFQLPKVWSPKPKSEITALPDDRLIDYCLEFPYECVNEPNYISEIRLRSTPDQKQNANSNPFLQSLQSKIQMTTDKTYFGCYCRKEPDLSIYENCPIDLHGLDNICKSKYDCLEKSDESETTNGLGKKQCHKKFKDDLSNLMKTKESKDKIHQGKDNFERMIFYTKKLWALEVLKESKL